MYRGQVWEGLKHESIEPERAGTIDDFALTHIQNTKPTTGIDKEFKEAFEKEKGINRLWTLVLFMTLVLIKTQ